MGRDVLILCAWTAQVISTFQSLASHIGHVPILYLKDMTSWLPVALSPWSRDSHMTIQCQKMSSLSHGNDGVTVPWQSQSCDNHYTVRFMKSPLSDDGQWPIYHLTGDMAFHYRVMTSLLGGSCAISATWHHMSHMAFFKCWFANSKIWPGDYWVFMVEVFTYMDTLNCLVGILGYDKVCVACWHLPWKPSEACSECVLCCNIQVLIHDICDVRSVHTFPSHSSHLCQARIHTRPIRVVLNPAWLNHFHVCFDYLIPRLPLQNNTGGLGHFISTLGVAGGGANIKH